MGSDAAGDGGDEDDETAGKGGSGILEGNLHDGRDGEIGFRGCHDGVQVACCVEQGDEEAEAPGDVSTAGFSSSVEDLHGKGSKPLDHDCLGDILGWVGDLFGHVRGAVNGADGEGRSHETQDEAHAGWPASRVGIVCPDKCAGRV